MKTYEEFWNELAPMYPISKGAIRLPIVNTLQTLPDINMEQVLSELQKLLEVMLVDHAVGAGQRAKLAGEPELAPLISLDSDYTGVVRFDCVLGNDGAVKVLELNADYPDGLLLHDATYSALSDTDCSLHKNEYLKLFGEQTNVHISHPSGAIFLDAYYAEKDILEEAGNTVSIGDQSMSDDVCIHRRCIEVSKMSAQNLQNWSRSEVRHINSFALRTLGYKDLLEQSSHPFVPCTVSLERSVMGDVTAAREQWVLKPANGCEGEGIYFGWEYDDSQWRALLAQLPFGYIAQEFVSLPKRVVSLYVEGGIEERELYYDFCPHFFIKAGKVIGTGHVLMRFSQSPVVNVSQGGAIGYHEVVINS